jgi:hypothetical protein
MSYLGAVDRTSEPDSYSTAKDHPIWRATMSEELKALEKNETWSLITLPKGK